MTLETKAGLKYLWYVIPLMVFVFYSCKKESNHYISIDGNAQGTTFHIMYKDSLQREFSNEIDSLFRLIDKSMSLWDSTSVISRINRNVTTVLLDEHFINVFNKASEISNITDGAFDVTVGPLVRAWGFSLKNNATPPDSNQVDSLRALTGYRKISILNGQLLKQDPRIIIDFNAIAQGYTVDLISGFLMSKGVDHLLVEIGGEIRTKGVNERGTPWQVGIDKPLDSLADVRPLQTTIYLGDKSLATSGSYRKYIVKDGKKLSHVIDPATGFPLQQSLLSVSVIAEDCTSADAYATAFLVLGIDRAMTIAKSEGLEIYCIYLDDSGELQTVATQAFLK